MSNNLANLDMVASLTREGKAIDEALPIMAKNGYSVIKHVPMGSNIVLSHQVKKDLTEVTHFDKEVPHVSEQEAVAILKANNDAFRSLESACASLIADKLVSDSRSQTASMDAKAWSEIKKELETSLGKHGILSGTLPQQWQNYWSKTKKALSLGFPVASLVYQGKSGMDSVVGRYELQQFIKAQETKPDKLVTFSQSFEKLAIRLDGGDDGEGEIFQGGDITVSQRAAAILAEVALSNLSTENQSEAIASLGLAHVMSGLVKQYGMDSVLAELDTIKQLKAA